MYESYIVDELGNPKMRCGDFSEMEIKEILDEHPEWKRECIWVNPESIF